MRVIIAGSREFHPRLPYAASPAAVASAMRDSGFTPSEVVSGGARGIDASGEVWAQLRGIPVKRFQADWRKHGAAAGPIRNRLMAEYGDALVAIWDGSSRGTANMIAEARSHGLGLYVVITKLDTPTQTLRLDALVR